jgi:hypothetical protein
MFASTIRVTNLTCLTYAYLAKTGDYDRLFIAATGPAQRTDLTTQDTSPPAYLWLFVATTGWNPHAYRVGTALHVHDTEIGRNRRRRWAATGRLATGRATIGRDRRWQRRSDRRRVLHHLGTLERRQRVGGFLNLGRFCRCDQVELVRRRELRGWFTWLGWSDFILQLRDGRFDHGHRIFSGVTFLDFDGGGPRQGNGCDQTKGRFHR